MNENQLIEMTERYLNGELSNEEKLHFEKLCQENAAIKSRVEEHLHFTGLIKQYGARVELEKRLNDIHQEIDVHALTEELTVHPSWVVKLWRNHHSKISVAASVAIFAMMVTLYATGYFSKNTPGVTELKREVQSYKNATEKLNHSTNELLHEIKVNGRHLTTPSKFDGTGFALTSTGYLITNYHVVRGADSLYVQNATGDSYHAKLIYSEPMHDIAILKIDDAAFSGLGTIPYTFRKNKSDVGEEVYTIGYPRDDYVYDRGYLSSSTGFNGDTTTYQLSLPVNPGNSGGPLLDSKGNVIGIVNGKQMQNESVSFAIKSSYIFKAVQSVTNDTTANTILLNTSSKNSLAGLSPKQQIKKLNNYVFMVKVY
ncbi:trypsin-like peptidase domain-containing protein [Mucilaginibacter robiniae]|uniref:Trypsin-like peptidase domain-containing protein n=1 Tax=Mucilaginibacter robiniae TaxID=2728022 RepID=A0A7L5E3L9_9SPHI|nr:S1C family serine protease [Mucilaginibacter robiniae]QJD97952.1 trypsin-like peptidase domain-containing protein [Mucilaginibacter robiniae]